MQAYDTALLVMTGAFSVESQMGRLFPLASPDG